MGWGMAKRRRRRKKRASGGLRRLLLVLVAAAVGLWWVGCRGQGHGPLVRLRIPERASFAQVTDSLAAHHIVRAPLLFRVYAYLTGASRHVKPGTYGFHPGTGWERVLRDLEEGRVLTAKLVVPEGWRLPQIAARLARITPLPEDSILALLKSPATVQHFRVPGPTMEGYLYPATYSWGIDTPLDSMLATMVRRYRKAWTPERRAAADSLRMSERDVVTLASIVQAEAKVASEMPIIAAVYLNRLRIGMRLQADPTVQYVLPERRDRLMYSDIGGVGADAYNTYTHNGLPPGPIGCPSEQAIDAVLHPAKGNYLYFVAKPDGHSIFTRSLAEHNRAKAQVRAMMRADSAAAAAGGNTPPATTSGAVQATPPVAPPPAAAAPAGPPTSAPPKARGGAKGPTGKHAR